MGKTTICALLVSILAQRSPGSVLAIDADPNSNLGEVLGLPSGRSIGEVLDELSASLDNVPGGMSKDRYLEYQVQQAVAEGEGFDLLTMGKPEGPGCYCYVNNILRAMMEKLSREYRYVVIDNEAGLEHLSRRTTRRADMLLVVSDPTAVGLRAAARINALAGELKIEIGKRKLLLNKVQAEVPASRVAETGLELLGTVPMDAQIAGMSIEGAPLVSADQSWPAASALRQLGEMVWQK